MLQRELEPEIMSEWEDADCYDQMDHSAVNTAFVADLVFASEKLGVPVGPDVCDLGAGTALIPIELCQRVENARVMAVDASISMLELAKYRIEVAGVRDRIQLHHGDVNQLGFADDYFDTTMSNSIVHHLANPKSLFESCARLTKSGGLVFVRDLLRPDSVEAIEELVHKHAGQEGDLAQQLFRQSLHAALTIDEVAAILESLALDTTNLTATSDRHWTWFQTIA